MKISVILNTVNENPDLLKRAINSYVKQPGCELLISTLEDDPSVEFVKKNYRGVKVVTMRKQGEKSPKGSFLQLNNALPHITGDWFTFASGNDYSYPFKLAIERNLCIVEKKEVCYSAFDLKYPDGTYRTQLFHPYNRDKHLLGNFVSDCSLISKRLVDKYLPFRTELNNYAYWDLWLRIYEGEGNVFVYNPKPTWAYVQHQSSMHIKRQKSPELIVQAQADRERMLSLHR